MTINKKIGGVAIWFITDSCNYGCSYCFTKKSQTKVEDHKVFLKSITDKIPRDWRFYIMGGGEPFTHPDFFKLIGGLVKAGYRFSILSNFSAPLKDLERFFRIAGKNLDFFSASMHLEQTRPEIFIEKIQTLRKSFPAFKRFHVLTVLKRRKTKEYESLKKLFSDKKIPLYFQGLKTAGKNKEFRDIDYSPAEKKFFAPGSWPPYPNPSLTGQACDAGQKFIYIDPAGGVFRCVPKPEKEDGYYMGNLLNDKIVFHEKSLPCQEKFCFCGNRYHFYKKTMEQKIIS